MRCVIDLDKTVFSGGRASLLRPLPSFRNGATRTGRRDFLGLVGLYTGAKVRLFRRMGKKSAFYSLRPTENCFFRHGNLVLPALFFRPLSRFASWSHIIIEESAGRCRGTSPQSTTRIRRGGGRRWSTCIKRWNVATLSPRRRGDTARPIQGDRRKPRRRRRNPKNRRVGVEEHPLSPPPEGAGEAAGDGAHASSGGTSPRSLPGEGGPLRGQSARNPRNRQDSCRDE